MRGTVSQECDRGFERRQWMYSRANFNGQLGGGRSVGDFRELGKGGVQKGEGSIRARQ